MKTMCKLISRLHKKLANLDLSCFQKEGISAFLLGQICYLFYKYCFVFVALRPMSSAMVIAGRSVHLTSLFPGQARASG